MMTGGPPDAKTCFWNAHDKIGRAKQLPETSMEAKQHLIDVGMMDALDAVGRLLFSACINLTDTSGISKTNLAQRWVLVKGVEVPDENGQATPLGESVVVFINTDRERGYGPETVTIEEVEAIIEKYKNRLVRTKIEGMAQFGLEILTCVAKALGNAIPGLNQTTWQ